MKTEYDPPVFVVGSARSGTTLLYSILQSSGEFALYQAETLLLEVCRPKYGDLKFKKNYDRFINDWICSKQFHRSGLSPDEFVKGAKDYRSSYVDFMQYFMECISEKQGKKRWAEQTPGHVYYMKELSKAFDNSKFIHVIRDGRDVAISRRKEGWSGTKSKDPVKQLIYSAISWEKAVEYGQINGKKGGDNYLEIRYEDIICDLDKVIKQINDFLHIKIDKSNIENYAVGVLKKGNSAFGETMEGISKKGLYRWKKELTEKENLILHFTIGEKLNKLGYDVSGNKELYKSWLCWKLKIKKILYRSLIFCKSYLKNKTFIGRFTASKLEIGS
jgi:hypothetical protein